MKEIPESHVAAVPGPLAFKSSDPIKPMTLSCPQEFSSGISCKTEQQECHYEIWLFGFMQQTL